MPDGVPFWVEGHAPLGLPALAEDLAVDVAIVGAGMVGLHCALGLARSGLRVAVLEARQVGRQATGKSTAKITSQHGLRYARLIRDFGEERAKIYAETNQQALETICGLCGRIGDGAVLQRRDAFVYARDAKEAASLEEEAQAATALGLPASLADAADLSFTLPAETLLRFANQAQFDPVGYLRGLVGLLPEQMRVFEHSRVAEVEPGETLRLSVNGRRVTARYAVIATQLPVVGEGRFYMKAFPFAHPVAAAPLPEGIEIGGMFKSAGSPSHSFRTTERDGRHHLIAAGNEFKTGEPEAQADAVADLRDFLKEHFGIAEPTHLWINEDFRAMDGAAFVGPATRKTPNLLVATGFDAWGITQGAVAGEILAAAVQDKEHPAASLFDATRVKPFSGGPTFLKEGAAAGLKMARDKLWGGSGDLGDIPPGGGAVISRGGEKLAVRRDADGRLSALSAVCTHLGCLVAWNAIDRTWDCACHGSRFEQDGAVLSGPATSPLDSRNAALEDGKD